MTRIDFYQLTPQHNFDRVLCQLCQKAWENKQHTLLLTQSAEQSAHLDQKLWTFDDDSFVPHDCELEDDFKTPILIHNAPTAHADRPLLINLAQQIPDYFAQFERVIELVTEDNKQLAREHYSFYKQRGYPLQHVNL